MTSSSRCISLAVLCTVLGAVAQQPAPVDERERIAEKLQAARVRLLEDTEIAPLHDRMLTLNGQLRTARDAHLAQSPELAEKQAKHRALLVELTGLLRDPELSEVEKRDRREALVAEMRTLSAELRAADTELPKDLALVALQAQADDAAAAVQEAIKRKLSEDPQTAALLSKYAEKAESSPAPAEGGQPSEQPAEDGGPGAPTTEDVAPSAPAEADPAVLP